MTDIQRPDWATGECLSDEDRIFVEVMYRHWRDLDADRIMFTSTPHAIAVEAVMLSIVRLVAAITKIATDKIEQKY